eukprot:5655131-Prymnesium_polylepis.1
MAWAHNLPVHRCTGAPYLPRSLLPVHRCTQARTARLAAEVVLRRAEEEAEARRWDAQMAQKLAAEAARRAEDAARRREKAEERREKAEAETARQGAGA